MGSQDVRLYKYRLNFEQICQLMQFFAVTVFDRWYGQTSSFRHGDGGDI